MLGERARILRYSKRKVRHISGHEDSEVEYRYISTLSLTLALDVVGGQYHAPATLSPGKDPVPNI